MGVTGRTDVPVHSVAAVAAATAHIRPSVTAELDSW